MGGSNGIRYDTPRITLGRRDLLHSLLLLLYGVLLWLLQSVYGCMLLLFFGFPVGSRDYWMWNSGITIQTKLPAPQLGLEWRSFMVYYAEQMKSRGDGDMEEEEGREQKRWDVWYRIEKYIYGYREIVIEYTKMHQCYPAVLDLVYKYSTLQYSSPQATTTQSGIFNQIRCFPWPFRLFLVGCCSSSFLLFISSSSRFPLLFFSSFFFILISAAISVLSRPALAYIIYSLSLALSVLLCW